MLKQIATLTTAMIIASISIAAVPSPIDLEAPKSTDVSKDVRLRAKLEGRSLASGSAKFEARARRGTVQMRFSVEIEDATPNTVYGIYVNGSQVGEVKTDNIGFADLNLRTVTDDNGAAGAFPMLKSGDLVQVPGLRIRGTLR